MKAFLPPRAAPQNQAHLKAGRRQLRRGTHSCWECKRRKMKCVFEAAANATACYGCRRRGSRCLSQEFPEDSAIDMEMVAKLNKSAGRAETVSTISGPNTPPSHRPLAPVSTTLEPIEPRAIPKSESLSRYLHRSLPSREDTERIYNATPQRPMLAHEMMTMPYTCLSPKNRPQSGNLLEIPDPEMHPVLIARHMLLLASLLQHLHLEIHADINGLSETPGAISERLANLAISCVTTKDELLGSIEGLECIMMESVYQANLGNLRRSWVAGRRAVSVAQLMGLNRSDNRAQYEVLDSRTKSDPRIMWSRIVFLDRFLCLLLGLPQGCTEETMGSEALITLSLPMERLERMHCVVASRVLERNGSEPSADDLSITRTLDLALQKAARSVPGKWWLPPKLDKAGMNPRTLLWNTGRLFAQVLHYNLLNQLHLPYMLRSSTADPNYEYSRITCVNASREVLTRFITLRSFNGIASSCRIIDFLALMAAITLSLAHLDSHHLGAENLLAHQYHSDRAMIEQVQENFREVESLSSDALGAHSADLLQRLLAIDADSPCGSSEPTGMVTVHKAETRLAQAGLDDDRAVSVHIPYFGIIRITRNDSGTMRPRSQATMGPESRAAQPQSVGMSHEDSPRGRCANPQIFDGPHRPLDAQSRITVRNGSGHFEPPVMMHEVFGTTQAQPGALSMPISDADYCATNSAPQHTADMTDPALRQGEYPGLAAGMEDWAFQGVDLAFFDSLMRTTANDGNEMVEWTMVGQQGV